jgi:hypothetical protein
MKVWSATVRLKSVTMVILAGIMAALASGFSLFAQDEPAPTLFSPEVANNLQIIYSVGQAYGNRGDVFSKVGDSITENLAFMHPFGWGTYDLGPFGSLQGVIDHFNYRITDADGGTSFTHESLAADVGWASWGVLTPELADLEGGCLGGEMPLECEYRIMRPAFAIIMFGTNDASYLSPEDFRYYMERILQRSLDFGVIPIFSTIPMRPDQMESVYAFNAVIADMTADFRLPLLDYAAAMAALPDLGLAWDEIHPSSPPSYRPQEAAIFTPDYLQYGYNVRNLTALQMLDAVWRTVDRQD